MQRTRRLKNHPWFAPGADFVDCGTGHQESINEIRSELNHETDILALNGAGDLRLRWK